MKIAVIGDIHSNLLAFNLAINDAKKEKVDKFIFLGDYITDGENSNEILNIVKSLADYAILGNREKYILNYSPEKKEYNNYKTIANTYNSLKKESIDYINSLKEFNIIKLNNWKILIIHGDGYSNIIEDIDSMFDLIIDKYDFDICLFGHSHKYLYKKYKDKIFLNPGSIGQPTDYPKYKYCIIELSDEINVFLREFKVSDTFAAFETDYKKTNYYKENFVWSNLILNGIRDGKDYCAPFIQLFNEKIELLGEISANEFNELWESTYKDFCNIFK